jgi:hypothetical protein
VRTDVRFSLESFLQLVLPSSLYPSNSPASRVSPLFRSKSTRGSLPCRLLVVCLPCLLTQAQTFRRVTCVLPSQLMSA